MDVLKSKENIRDSKNRRHNNSHAAMGASASASKQVHIAPMMKEEIPTIKATLVEKPNPKHEELPVISFPVEEKPIERNYDKNPTQLYISIQHKKWEEVKERCKVFPEECKTWVFRAENNGKLRWRLLPLHAAIIFKAPQEIIHALLVAYPHAARQKDDQGMLPIHLAFRNESPVVVVQYLLMSCPSSMKVSDRKGRIPFVMVQNSRSASKELYLEALKMTEMYHSVTKASCEYDLLHEFRKNSAVGSSTMEFDAEKINFMAKIDALEAELEKTQGASEVLVNHVNSLEAKLSSKNDTESFLASKIAKMDSDLREITHVKELAEAELQRQRKQLREKNNELQAEADELKIRVKQKDDNDKVISNAIETQLSSKSAMKAKFEAMERENAKCKAEVESMEELLKKKIESEHSLANQVSALAARLAESTADTCTSTNAFQNRINILGEEKGIMQSKLDMLTIKVQSVLKTLELMSHEHERILEISTLQEETMQTAQKHQESLAVNAARNEQMMIDAAWEREEICRILTRQAKQVEKSSEERSKLVEEVKLQNAKIENVGKSRRQLAESIKNQKGRMNSLMEDINVLRGFAADDSYFCLDDTLDASKITNASDEVNELNDSRLSEMEQDAKIEEEINKENDEDEFEQSDDSTANGSELSFDESGSESDSDNSNISVTDTRVQETSVDYDESEDLRNGTSVTQSVDLIVVPSDNESVTCEDDETALSLVDIESSVDKLCSEAARLVASMPKKEYP